MENLHGFIAMTGWNIVDFIWMTLIFFLAILVVLPNFLSDYMEYTLFKLCRYGKLTPKVGAPFAIIQLPKQYFTHYYIFSILWTGLLTALATSKIYGSKLNEYKSIDIILLFSSKKNLDCVSLFISLALIMLQGARRVYECVAISVFSRKAKINVFSYLLGLIFYGMEPLTLLCKVGTVNDMPHGELRMRHIVGVFGFSLASFYQHLSMSQLARLRKTPQDTSYNIPCGHLFDYVSCPHYFTEILIYLFITCTVGFSHNSWKYILIFVTLIHVVMADMSHNWYKQKFKTYPKNRKALIPYLY